MNSYEIMMIVLGILGLIVELLLALIDKKTKK